MDFVVTLACVCVKRAITLTTSSPDSWWSSIYFQGIHEQKREPHLQICPEVKCQIQCVLDCLFQEHEQDKATSKETPAFLILAMKRKNLSLQGFCYLILWSSEQGLGVKRGKIFYSCQSKEPMGIYNGSVFHIFFMDKQLQ